MQYRYAVVKSKLIQADHSFLPRQTQLQTLGALCKYVLSYSCRAYTKRTVGYGTPMKISSSQRKLVLYKCWLYMS